MEEEPMMRMVGAMMMAMVGLVLIQALQAAPEPVTPNASVLLSDAPDDATMWDLVLTDWDITVPIHFIGSNGKERLDITEAATFEVPSGLTLPLRVMRLQITKWNEDETALLQLYYVQSIRPYLWDWDLNDWGTEPDPTYEEVFIPALGSYYYDVAVEDFLPV